MNSAHFRNITSLIFLGLVMVLGSFFMNAPKAFAAAGDIQITATREGDGGTLFGAMVEVQCTGGTWTQLAGSPTTDVVGVASAAPQGASSCNNGDTIDIRVTKTGYVTDTVMTAGTYLSASDPNIYTVSDIQFQLKVVVADQLGNPVTAFTVIDFSISLYNGEQNSLDSGSNMYWAVTASNAALTLQNSGYVDSESINTGFSDVSTSASGQTVITLGVYAARTAAIASGESVTALGIVYGHKMILTREGDGAPVTGAVPSVASWVEDGTTGVYYAAIPVSMDGGAVPGFVSRSGYVNYTIGAIADRTTGSDPQVTDTLTDMLFQLKVVTADELGNTITASGLSTKTFNGVAATTTSAANAYWAVTASNAGLVLSKDGYVNTETTNTGFSDISTSASGQTVITLGAHTAKTDATAAGSSVTSKGLVFGQKVIVTRQSDNAAVSGATVTAGSSNTACTEGGSTGIYYCPVLVAQDGMANDIMIVVTGYSTNTTGDTVNRLDGTTAQGVISVSLSTIITAVSGGIVPLEFLRSPNTQSNSIGNQAINSGCVGNNLFSSTTGHKCSIRTEQYQFLRTLKIGMSGEDVRFLQVFLNTHGAPITSAGFGSLGKETSLFGVKTQRALSEYQKENGIVPAVGFLGPITRAHINDILKNK